MIEWCLFVMGLLGLSYFIFRSGRRIEGHNRVRITGAARLIYANATNQQLKLIIRAAPSIEDWGRAEILSASEKGIATIYARRAEGLPHKKVRAKELVTLCCGVDDELTTVGASKPEYIDAMISLYDAQRILRSFEQDLNEDDARAPLVA